jgi:hypothetical protein
MDSVDTAKPAQMEDKLGSSRDPPGELVYREIPQRGDGNCLYHTLTSYYEGESRLDDAIELSREIGVVADGTWQSPQTAIAFNQMLGVNTKIFIEDSNAVMTGKVAGDAPTCYIRYNNNHYTLLRPDYKGDKRYNIQEIREIENNIPAQDIQLDIAEKYAEFLTEQGIETRAIKSEDHNSANLEVHLESGSSVVPPPMHKKRQRVRVRGIRPFTTAEDDYQREEGKTNSVGRPPGF